MKVGKSLQDLLIEVERRSNAKKDLVASTKNLTLTDDGNHLRVGDDQEFKVNNLAHDQIGTYCGIPAKYYDRLRDKAPDLLATNVNRWFQNEPVKRLVRTLDGVNRAFLSDKYRPMENEELAEAVIPPLLEMNLEVMSSEITERRLYIKAVDPKVARELKAVGGQFGDGRHNIVRCLAPAITISNSEVGAGALSVLAGVYDSFCSNLATFGERSMRKYHVGARHELAGEDVYAILSDEARRKTDEALWAQVRDITKAAFQRAQFDALCDKIAETQTQKIEGDTVKVISLASRRLNLTETEGKSVLRHLIEGGDLSRFGLYNAVTRAAQDDDVDYDRATELERAGGQIIELPPSEWKELAKAA